MLAWENGSTTAGHGLPVPRFSRLGPFLQRPPTFSAFPPHPPDLLSRLPRIRPPVARPVSPKPLVPAPAYSSAGGLQACHWAGHNTAVSKATFFLSTHPPQTLLIGASRCRFPASDPCPFPPTLALSHAPPAESPRRRHIPDAFPSAPVPNLPLVIFHLQRTLLRQIPPVVPVRDYQTMLKDELSRRTNSPAASTPRLRGVKNGRTA